LAVAVAVAVTAQLVGMVYQALAEVAVAVRLMPTTQLREETALLAVTEDAG
tara:strand:- start:1440 stop:1592 length:153 start_codon:yes stop_codon:yes gene_type:complete